MPTVGSTMPPCSWSLEGKTKNVTQMLKLAFEKQKTRWKTCAYDINNNAQECEVSGYQRDAAISWLLKLNDIMNLSPETIFTAASLLDQVLNTVKAHSKYLYCIAISCFFVAIKITEEYELVPTARQLLDISCSDFSIAELLRMEMIVLKKLHWNIYCITSFDFLHIFHQFLILNCHKKDDVQELNSSHFLNLLGMKLKSLLKYHWLASYAPSTLALSLMSLELEMRCRKSLDLMLSLRTLLKNNDADFYMCRDELSSFYEPTCLVNYLIGSSNYCLPENEKIEQPNLDDIYDSIRNLYG